MFVQKRKAKRANFCCVDHFTANIKGRVAVVSNQVFILATEYTIMSVNFKLRAY